MSMKIPLLDLYTHKPYVLNGLIEESSSVTISETLLAKHKNNCVYCQSIKKPRRPKFWFVEWFVLSETGQSPTL